MKNISAKSFFPCSSAQPFFCPSSRRRRARPSIRGRSSKSRVEEPRPRPGRQLCGLPPSRLPALEAAVSCRLSPARLHRRRIRLDPVRRDRAHRGPGHRRARDPADDHRHARRRRQLVHQRPQGQGALRGHVRQGAHPAYRRQVPHPRLPRIPRHRRPVDGRLGTLVQALRHPERLFAACAALSAAVWQDERDHRPETGGLRPDVRLPLRPRIDRQGTADALPPRIQPARPGQDPFGGIPEEGRILHRLRRRRLPHQGGTAPSTSSSRTARSPTSSASGTGATHGNIGAPGSRTDWPSSANRSAASSPYASASAWRSLRRE